MLTPRHQSLRIVALVGPFVLFPLLNFPHALPSAIFLTTTLFWLFELLPLPATALMVPVLATVSGVLTVNQAFSPFGSEIPFLFLGCFLLAQSIEKHGLDRRIAFSILASPLGSSSPGRLVIGVATVCFALSMWISNTATCAMMVPVCPGIIRVFDEHLEDPVTRRRFATRLLIACAFASSIGGMATPIGSPPNILAIQFLKERGISVSFLDWMTYGLPLSLVALVGLLLLLAWRFPLPKTMPGETTDFLKKQWKTLGSPTQPQVQTTIVFGLAIFLWVLPDLLSLGGLEPLSALVKARLPMSTVALGAGLLLFFLPTRVAGEMVPNLDWKDATKVDWGTILLFGGGLVLSAVLEQSGLARYLGENLFSFDISFPILALLMVFISLLLSEFASNTATAAIVIPIVLAVLETPKYAQLDPKPVVILIALAASFGFMLPVSTPPNAIAFGTGHISSKDMIRTGIILDLVGGLLISGLLYSALVRF